MAQEGDKSSKINFRVHLSGKKYIYGDGYSYWIVRESRAIQKTGKKAGEEVKRNTRLSGYHTDFENLLNSYLQEQTKHAEIDGEIEDLVKFIKKTKAEIRSWGRKMDKVLEGEEDD